LLDFASVAAGPRDRVLPLHQAQRTLPTVAIVRAAQALAVDGHDLAVAELRDSAGHVQVTKPSRKAPCSRRAITQLRRSGEGSPGMNGRNRCNRASSPFARCAIL
jgi:hypothetical protein